MLRIALIALASVLAGLTSTATAAATTDVVMLIDGSGSIDSADWRLQRDGMSAALRDPANVPLDGSVAIGVVQWSSTVRLEKPLTAIRNKADLDGVVGAIERMSQLQGNTHPGDGLTAGTAEMRAHGRPASHQVLCMSTDGTTNGGRQLATAVTEAKLIGVDRYSVVGIEDGSTTANVLRSHYGPHVFGGGAVTVARDTTEFSTLIDGSCFGDPVRLRALEVTQAVQNWHNSVELVGDRTTAVRAFVETPSGGDQTRVTGRLVGTLNGVPLPGSPLPAKNRVLAREDITSRRSSQDDSLNFVLPQSWSRGDVTLRFEAGGNAVECAEPGSAGSDPSDCEVQVSFTDPVSVGVTFFKAKIGSSAPSDAQMAEQVARVRSALPVSDLRTGKSRTLEYRSTPTVDTLLGDLLRIRKTDLASCVSPCVPGARDRYYAVTDTNGIPMGNDTVGGIANGIPGTVAAGAIEGAGSSTARGYARNRVAHELAHTFEVHHAVDNTLRAPPDRKYGRCSEEASLDAPGHRPFYNFGLLRGTRPVLGSLIDGDDAEVWGTDYRYLNGPHGQLAVVDPRATWPLMSYCRDGAGQGRWTAKFEWEQTIAGIRHNVHSSAAESVVRPAAGSKGVLVSGRFSTATGTAQIDQVVPLPFEGDATPGSGAWEIRLLDEHGDVLASRRLQPEFSTADTADPAADLTVAVFAEVMSVPQDAKIGRVELRDDTLGVIGSRDAPAGDGVHVSDVEISDPSITSDPADLDWASDSSGQYAVFYSPDGGASWTPVTFDVASSDARVSPDTLTATADGKFAVAGSDGVNGTVAELGGITVANAAPSVTVISPAGDDDSPSGVQIVRFEAAALDRDETISSDRVEWASSLDGPLGTGDVLEIAATDLSEGHHTITVTATDSEGATGTDTVEIDVYRVEPPPPAADLTAAVSAPGTVVGGQDAALTVTVTNAGPNGARDLTLTVTADQGMTAGAPQSLDGWDCAAQGNGLSCTRPAMPAGASSAISVPVSTATVSAAAQRAVTANVTSGIADPLPANNTASATITVTPSSGGGGGGGGSVPPRPSAPGGGQPAAPGPPSGGGGGPAGAGSTSRPPATTVTRAAVYHHLRADQRKLGRRALRKLRRNGKTRMRVTMLAAGELSVKLRTTGRDRRTVASGRVTASAAGETPIVLRVTKKGRKTLRRDRLPALRVSSRFKGSGVTVTASGPVRR